MKLCYTAEKPAYSHPPKPYHMYTFDEVWHVEGRASNLSESILCACVSLDGHPRPARRGVSLLLISW